MMLETIRGLVNEMCDLEKSGEYTPILEADVAGFLYHLMLARGVCTLKRVHLDTRVIGASDMRFDLVIGDVRPEEDGRPAVYPEIVIEIKVFPKGFNSPQHRVHFEHIINDDSRKNSDLRKLGSLPAEVSRVEFIFDQADYLSGKYSDKNRTAVIMDKRDEVSPRVQLLFARKIAGDWQILVK